MRVCVLGASFDTGNMGVSVLAAGSVQNSLRQFPDADVYLLNYGLHAENIVVGHGASRSSHRLVPLRFSKYLFQRNNVFVLIVLALAARLVPRVLGRERFLRTNAVLASMLDTDVFVSIAGGDSFSDIYGMIRLLYVGLPQILVLLISGRLVLLPQTIGPFRSRLARVVAKYILQGAETVYARDAVGVSAANEIAGLRGPSAKKLKFSYDLGFNVPPSPIATVPLDGLAPARINDANTVGLNISGLLWNEGRRFGLSLDYRALVLRSVSYFVEVAKVPVVLVPHVVSPGNADSDGEAIQEAYAILAKRHPGWVAVLGERLSYDQTKYVIGRFDFFMGARMHACIAALSQCVPCCAWAYSGKFEGVMASVGAGTITLDLRTASEEAAMGLIVRNYEARAMLRESLAQRMAIVAETIAIVEHRS